jgi:hypothetical protein
MSIHRDEVEMSVWQPGAKGHKPNGLFSSGPLQPACHPLSKVKEGLVTEMAQNGQSTPGSLAHEEEGAAIARDSSKPSRGDVEK